MKKFNEVFGDLVKELKEGGFKCYVPEVRQKTWFYVVKGNDIAYVQYDRFCGFTVSTTHMPNSKTGTGFRVIEGKEKLTVDDVKQGFICYPNWCSDKESVKKYKSWEDRQRIAVNQIIKYNEVTS